MILCSDTADVKSLICFMKHHVNVSSLMMDKIYKLSKMMDKIYKLQIRRILVWSWVDLNQFDIPSYLIKVLGLQLKCIQILAVHMESYKYPETNSKVFYENSAILYTVFLERYSP